MKLSISVLIRFLPVLLGVILAVSTMACSDGNNERQTNPAPDPTGTNPTTSPQDTPVPTRFAAATPRLTQGESHPTSTATARPTPAVAIPAQATPTAISPTVSPSEPATTVSAAADGQGGTLNLVSRQVAPHSDVHMEVSAALAAWGPGIAYGRLMRFRSGDGVELPSLSVECEVCIGWEMTDGTTYEFRLRDDVMWQDLQPVNGGRLVAEDIAYSYERQRSEGMPNGVLLNIVKTVEVEAQDLLRINIFAPDADFLGALADGHSKIVAREAVELSGDLRSGPTVGTGAWVLEEAREDMTFTFRRNEDYFLDGMPMLDRLRIHTITDDDTAYAAFRVNNVDVHRLRQEEWEEFRLQKPDATMLKFKETGIGLEVAFKTNEPPFDDVRVRRAVMLAMRPERGIEETWQGAAYQTQGVPLGRADWWLGEEQLGMYFDDHPRATALLSEAVGALPVPVVVRAGDFGAEYLEHAERIAGEMRSVGFAPELEIVDRRRFGEEVWLGGDYQMFVGPMAPVASPNGYMLAVLSSEGAWNTTGHSDEALDALILEQAGEYDAEERRRLVMEIQRHAMEQAYRFMPAAAVSLWAWWPQVQGLEPNFVGSEYSHWERVWLEE